MDQFVAAFQTALRRYTAFEGRTSVGGYWRFVAVNVAITIVLYILAAVADLFGIVVFLYGLALLIPGLAAASRRLRDTGRSGWFLLVGLVPFVGWIIVLVWLIAASDGPNEYGQGPED